MIFGGGLLMARVDANINKETLSFICSQIGVTVVFLSQKTGFAEEKINAWLDVSNTTYPTLNQAKTLAKILKVPFAGLYMDKANIPIKQLPPFRNLRTLPFSYTSDDSSLNLAIVELIRYNDFLVSAKTEMNIEAPTLTLPLISDNAGVGDYANTIQCQQDKES